MVFDGRSAREQLTSLERLSPAFRDRLRFQPTPNAQEPGARQRGSQRRRPSPLGRPQRGLPSKQWQRLGRNGKAHLSACVRYETGGHAESDRRGFEIKLAGEDEDRGY